MNKDVAVISRKNRDPFILIDIPFESVASEIFACL